MGVIVTSDARCKDCYKCVRHCPIKAIRVVKGKAQVWDELCVHDGACINVCPQGAKKAESHQERVQNFLAESLPVVASVAPSFAAVWPGGWLQLTQALQARGFAAVEETASAAGDVARAHVAELKQRKLRGGPFPVVTSSCPAVVSMIENHFPEKIALLADVVSPMIAHGRRIKVHYDNHVRVVFIGPCAAKKHEMTLLTHQGSVDAALTFEELESLLAHQVDALPGEETIPSTTPEPATSRLFPLEGGLLEAADLKISMMDMLHGGVRVISGMHECLRFLREVDVESEHIELVELMACEHGCIGGPFIPRCSGSMDRRRQQVWDWYEQQDPVQVPAEANDRPAGELKRTYRARQESLPEPGKEALAAILAQMGKTQLEDELNCGACGYDTCREKAVAVFRGAAEVEMCIPYMRSRAESMAHVIMNEMPNGVIVVDRDLRVVSLNPAVEQMFHCQLNQMKGRKLGYLIDPKNFRHVLNRQEMLITEVDYPDYNRRTREYIFYVEGHDIVIGILVDVSREEKQKQDLVNLRAESMIRAQEVIDKQMRVAQEIAGLMGETTAETKTLLSQLMQVIRSEAEGDV